MYAQQKMTKTTKDTLFGKDKDLTDEIFTLGAELEERAREHILFRNGYQTAISDVLKIINNHEN